MRTHVRESGRGAPIFCVRLEVWGPEGLCSFHRVEGFLAGVLFASDPADSRLLTSQRDDGIDQHRAPRRKVSRSQSDEREKKGNGGESQRIGGRHSE